MFKDTYGRPRPQFWFGRHLGRNAHPSIVEIADTVTAIREIKHAYQKGIEAQRGRSRIESSGPGRLTTTRSDADHRVPMTQSCSLRSRS
ncbi:MAG: cob(I)yrinic acid a,c-diamide adenosyltransferase [Candidatus Korobacteraceae bacterium]